MDLLKQANAGKPVNEEDIPPPVSVKKAEPRPAADPAPELEPGPAPEGKKNPIKLGGYIELRCTL